jgi:CRISPR-associated protein Cmr1
MFIFTQHSGWHPRQYIAEKSTFQVTLAVHGDVPDGKEILKKAISAFWLFANLGGIGSRSRRCAGSIRVKKVENNLTNLCFDEPEDVQKLERQLKEGIKYIQQLWKTQFPKAVFTSRNTRVETASFDILDTAAEPKTCYIWILPDNKGTWNSAEEAMKSIGGNLKSYRRSLRLNKKTIFGLPIVVLKQHQQRGPNFKESYESLANSRMASPLLLRISKLQNNKYVGIAVLFKTEGEYVKNISDYTLIEKFISDNFDGAIKVEVGL